MSLLRDAWEGRAWVMAGGARPSIKRPGTDISDSYGRTGGFHAPGDGTWLPGMRWESWGSGSAQVSNEQAMRLSAVYACLRLLSEAIATLPLDTFTRDGETRLPFARPDYLSFQPPQGSRITYLSQIMLSLLTDGNAFVAVIRDDFGVPVDLIVLDPGAVGVTRGPGGQSIFSVFGVQYDGHDVMHIPGMMLPGDLRGVSPLAAAREVIDGHRKAQEYGASVHDNRAVPPAIIKIPDADPDGSRARRVAENWKAVHGGTGNAGKTGVLTDGAELQTIAMSPEDTQWLDSKRFGVSEIARFYGVPPHLIADASNSTSWGSGLAEQNLAFGQFSLRPWSERIEEAHTRLLTSHGLPDVFVKLNLDALLRASLSDRYASYAVGIASGFLTENEARRYEDLAPLPETEGTL